MAYCDMKVATFNSRYHGGEVELWYCSHSSAYELRYDVKSYSPEGLCLDTAVASYSASDDTQVAALMLDAIDIARTPLAERN